jgi:type 1 glutamine amidotransferase
MPLEMLFIIKKNSQRTFAGLLTALLLVACGEPIEQDSDPKTVIIGPDIVGPAMLVFSKTLEWRHNEGIAGADRYFVELGATLNMPVFTTVDSSVFNSEDLKRFKLVVFNNTTGDVLKESEQQAFEAWLKAGGGWIGIHGSGDGSQQAGWPWYQENLIGPVFISHPMAPQFQEAKLETLATDHPVMSGIPTEWRHIDEWYTFDGTPQEHRLVPLIGLDETTYSPVNTVYGDVSDLRMGPDSINHPIVWAGCVGDGRTVYSGLGHQVTAYDQEVPGKLLENAARWVLREVDAAGTGCP